MRVLHVPYSFPPDPSGGTEVYVEALAQCQIGFGMEAAVAVPAADSSRYSHNGISVWRFAASPNPSLRQMYGEGQPSAAAAFAHILDSFQPDLLHLHALTSAVSVLLASEAQKRGIPIVLNYHTPTVSCVRGTLMKWGAEVCDGVLNVKTCAACNLQAQGMSRPVARAIAALPGSVGGTLEQLGLAGGVWTALRMPELLAVRLRNFERLIGSVTRVVALCDWTRDLLIRNGVPEEKIVLNRQGIRWNWSGDSAPAARLQNAPVRVAFLGRSDPTKGAHILIQALRLRPELNLTLDLYGISQSGAGDRYGASLLSLIGDDNRMRIQPPIPSAGVVARLSEYDCLAVPSQWMETGPLVVLEAFAAGLPVIGSRLGGIKELVADGRDGLLVPAFSSAAAWSQTLHRIASETGILNSLRSGIRPPRRSEDSALEMLPLYEQLTGKSHADMIPCAGVELN